MYDIFRDGRFWACFIAALIMIGGFVVLRMLLRRFAYQSFRRRHDDLTIDIITSDNPLELQYLEEKVENFRQDVLAQDVPDALQLHRLLVRLINKKKATS